MPLHLPRLPTLFACIIATHAMLVPHPALAFWVVNFGTADTIAPGKIGFAAGIGGQVVFAGDPRKTNANLMIPHAGFRYGVSDRVDAGLRLAPVPLPYSSVGPGFGINLDLKLRLSERGSRVQFAMVGGLGGAHVKVEGTNRTAWSPNAAALATYRVDDKNHITTMARYVHLNIPTAHGGSSANYVDIAGASLGWKREISPNIALLPEVGAYWYDGRIAGEGKRGPGFQYGLMISTTF